jgi:uncharacterized membrane protein YdjX (TVP38/TMEM64 family)
MAIRFRMSAGLVRRILTSWFLWMLVVVVVLTQLTDRWVEHEGGARAVIEHFGIWAPIASFVLKAVTTMTPIGAVFISVLNGALFNFWLSIALNLCSGTTGGLIMYHVWKRGDHEFDIQAQLARLPRWFRVRTPDNFIFLVLVRNLPWAGGSLADLIAGSHRVPLRIYIPSILLGNLPGAVIYTLIGSGIFHL